MNKRPYKDITGNPVPKGTKTRFLFTDAVVNNWCPRCKCDAGFNCETPKGRTLWPPHVERMMNKPNAESL